MAARIKQHVCDGVVDLYYADILPIRPLEEPQCVYGIFVRPRWCSPSVLFHGVKLVVLNLSHSAHPICVLYDDLLSLLPV